MKRNISRLIGPLVAVISTVILLFRFGDKKWLSFFLQNGNLGWIGLSVFFAAVSYTLKGLRLYMIVLEKWKGLAEFGRVYTQITCVNLIFPLKLGELYRIYRLGNTIHDYPYGVLAVIIDRFFDTIPLIGLFLLSMWQGDTAVSWMMVVVFLVFILMFLAYELYPTCYHYLNHYLIVSHSTKVKLRILKGLEFLHEWRNRATSLFRGRGSILLIVSLVSWGFEFGALVCIGRFIGQILGMSDFISYLNRIFVGGSDIYTQVYLMSGLMFMLFAVLVTNLLFHGSNSMSGREA